MPNEIETIAILDSIRFIHLPPDRRTEICDALKTAMQALRELAEADRDGRLVVLPCKVGDTVYLVLPKCRASRIPLAECNFFECDDCPRNKREIFEQKATTEMLSMMLFEKYNTLYVFGKTVFLTRAEAEATLASAKQVEASSVASKAAMKGEAEHEEK